MFKDWAETIISLNFLVFRWSLPILLSDLLKSLGNLYNQQESQQGHALLAHNEWLYGIRNYFVVKICISASLCMDTAHLNNCSLWLQEKTSDRLYLHSTDWKWATADSFWECNLTGLDSCMRSGRFYFMNLKSDTYTEC